MIKSQTVKEFFKGTPNNAHIDISFGSEEQVFSGSYRKFKSCKSFECGDAEFDEEEIKNAIVLSYDVDECEDGVFFISVLI